MHNTVILREGIRIRVDTGEQSSWEGTDFMVCPRCKQVVRIEEMRSRIHFCLNPRRVISEIILS